MDFGGDRHRHATIGLRVGALGLGTPLFDGWSRTSWFSSFKARFSRVLRNSRWYAVHPARTMAQIR
jgi:hypothetical protein